MDQLNKPSALSLSGNLSENWRKFIQQVEIFLQAAGKDQESDAVKIAILLNLAGPDAIELYNTFTLSDADAKKYTKVVKAFEQYCSPRKNIVFECFTFWQCTQAQDENVDQFITLL